MNNNRSIVSLPHVYVCSNQRDGTMDWAREGISSAPRAVPKVDMHTEPADPDGWGLWTNGDLALCSVRASCQSALTYEPWTGKPIRLGAKCKEKRAQI